MSGTMSHRAWHSVTLAPRDLIFVTSILLQEYRSTLWCSWDCGSRA